MQVSAMEMAMRQMNSALSVMAVVGTLAQAQTELEPGQQYKPGAQVKSSSLGIAFDLPEEWLGAYRQGADQGVLVLGSNSVEGVGLAIFVRNQASARVVQILNESQDLGDNVVLELDGRVNTEGAKVTARYLNQIYVGRALALLGPNQNHVIYFYAGPQMNEQLYTRLLNDLAASTEFTTVQTPTPQPADAPKGLASEWTRLLSGMMLKYLSSYNSGGGGGGMSSERVLHLCSNGSFAYFGSSSVSVYVPGATAGGGGSERSTGRWRIVSADQTTAVMLLQVDGGAEERLQLSYDGEKTFIGNERWFRVPSDACQ